MERIATDMVTRREALRRAAYLLGGVVSAPTVAAVLAGCERAGGGAETAQATARVLSADQRELVLALGERIIPETDTPGARAARVDEFIEIMLAEYYPAEDKQRFLAGLGRVDARAKGAFGKGFVELERTDQTAVVQALNRAAFRSAEARRDTSTPPQNPVLQEGRAETGRSHGSEAVSASGAVALDRDWDPEDVGGRSFFRTLKELVLVGYYTSEVGATEELKTNPMGVWRADIPLSEVGRAWA